MTVVGHPTNLNVWSVTRLYLKFCWCYSLPITTLILGHVSVGVIIVVFFENATIEYSSESLCASVFVCVCVFA